MTSFPLSSSGGRAFSSSSVVGGSSNTNNDSSLSSRTTSLFTPASEKDEITNPRLFRYLRLETFSEDEMGSVFDRIRQEHLASTTKDSDASSNVQEQNDPTIDAEMMESFFAGRLSELENERPDDEYDHDKDVAQLRRDFVQSESHRIWNTLTNDMAEIATTTKSDSKNPTTTTTATNTTTNTLSKAQFVANLRHKASSIDLRRAWPITSSMLLIGASVGIITPAMPFVVEQVGLTASEYGAVVSAFALARMLANVPSAIAIERFGRRPFMIHSLSLIALGVGGIGLASTFEELYLCRLMTGVGVSLLGGAATLMITDISTPLNRASTMAPVMSGFTAGTALGPAIGGFMVDSVGLDPTFYLVGASYLGVAAVNRMVLRETKRQPIKFKWRKKPMKPVVKEDDTLSGAVQNAVGQWVPLMKQRSVQSIMGMNAAYWMALAGAQMTVMPLILTDQAGLNLSATELGQVYMGMSLIQIVGNPLFARFIDQIGKAPAIVCGCTLISLPMAALPLCQDWVQLAAVCGIWASGSSMMSTAPLAYMSDKVAESERAQSIALLRTCGDVGFLVGASAIGALADWTGSLDQGMQTSAGLLLSATAWFAARQLIFAESTAVASQTTQISSSTKNDESKKK